MKILLIGKTGQLGGHLLRNLRNHDLYAPGRDALDIADRLNVEALIHDFRPNVVINTAAFHNVPLCEVETEKTFQINCIAVRDLAAACLRVGGMLVTFSSDYVFSGEKRIPYLESDTPGPLQVYGISRLAGEFAALATAPDHAVIIRTCGLYGISGAKSKGGNFVDRRMEDAKTHRVLEMSSEQVVCPTSAEDLSRAVIRLIDHPELRPGIYHLVNEGACTWYEFTRKIYELMNIRVELIPVDRRGMSGTMRRPLYSVLANTKAKKAGIALPHWGEALERYLQNKYGL